MEKRIGSILILVKDKTASNNVNTVLSRHSVVIMGRMGIPGEDTGVNVISLVVEGTTDEISSLTGQLGKITGVTARSVVARD